MQIRMANKLIAEASDKLLHMDEEELEAIRSLLVITLMKNTSLDVEAIYSFIYCDGKKILWN